MSNNINCVVTVDLNGNTSIEAEGVPIQISKNGQFLIDRDLNRDKINPIIDCDMELDKYINYEQKVLLYKSWESSKDIIIRTIADLLSVDKTLARALVIIGQRFEILVQGRNNAWNVKSRDMKILLAEKVKQLTADPAKESKNSTQVLHEVLEKFNKNKIEGEGGSIDENIDESKHESKIPVRKVMTVRDIQKKVKEEESVETLVEIVPTTTQQGVTRQEIEQTIKEWEPRINDRIYIEQKHEILSYVNTLKTQLRVLPVERLSGGIASSPRLPIKRQILPKKKPALLLPPVPGKKPQKSLK